MGERVLLAAQWSNFLSVGLQPQRQCSFNSNKNLMSLILRIGWSLPRSAVLWFRFAPKSLCLIVSRTVNMSDLVDIIQENSVHLGVWTIWSRGLLFGLTLTLSHKHGAALTSFLAVLVTLTGNCFWKIARFLAHQSYSSEDSQDALYHQRQAILRNTESSVSGFWRLLRVWWAWHKQENKDPFRRTIAPVALGASIAVVFVVASILSSQVANSMGNEVLLSSPYCGWLNESSHRGNNKVHRVLGHHANEILNSNINYVDRCYRRDTMGANCQFYIKPKLRYTVTRAIECPFPGKERICQHPLGGIRFDTGLLNSHDDIGVNSRPEHRFLWRRTLECAPLKNEGYVTIERKLGRPGSAPREFAIYWFGRSETLGNKTFQ
jgi:hypothetical protein